MMHTQSPSFTHKPWFMLYTAIIISLGLILSAWILGYQTKAIGSGRSTVSVKGLAEKKLQADIAEWHISAIGTGSTFTEALTQMRNQQSILEDFIRNQGFNANSVSIGSESVQPTFAETELNGRYVQTQTGYQASQTFTITSKDLKKIAASQSQALDFKALGQNIEISSPSFLVSNLESIKMSLISAASANAKLRAVEFLKDSDSQVGAIKSASQGAFYILPDTSTADTEDYGGSYDKTTVNKIARVVVTIDYAVK